MATAVARKHVAAHLRSALPRRINRDPLGVHADTPDKLEPLSVVVGSGAVSWGIYRSLVEIDCVLTVTGKSTAQLDRRMTDLRDRVYDALRTLPSTGSVTWVGPGNGIESDEIDQEEREGSNAAQVRITTSVTVDHGVTQSVGTLEAGLRELISDGGWTVRGASDITPFVTTRYEGAVSAEDPHHELVRVYLVLADDTADAETEARRLYDYLWKTGCAIPQGVLTVERHATPPGSSFEHTVASIAFQIAPAE